jgi:cytochrome P450
MDGNSKSLPELCEIPEHVPLHLVYDFDYLNMDSGETDAYAHWNKLHDGRPKISYTRRHGGHWIVSQYEDVAHVLSAYRDFSSIHQTIPKSTPHRLPPSEYDPPEHQDFRKLIASFFSPKSIADLEIKARELTTSLIGRFRDRGACEFASEFALEMPIGIFMTIADLPEKDRLYLIDLAGAITRPQSIEKRLEAFQNLFKYLGDIIAIRRETPGGDVLSAIATGRIDGGRPLTDEEAVGMAGLMVVAGLDTVAALLGFVAIDLANHPEHRRRLIDHPKDIPEAAEEFMRRYSVANLSREVATDMVYKGVIMKAGDMVLAAQSAAGIDPSQYDDPMTVDFDRKDKKNIGFGKGAHQCIGAFLARTEVRVFLEEWLKQIPDFSIAPGKLPITRTGSSNTVSYLPLVWRVES